MTDRRLCLAARSTAALALVLAAAAQAQAPASGVYRCGNAYSSTPCPGGQPVAADDVRSDAQRQQALAAKTQDARLARQLAAERKAREQAVAGQTAARIGPSEAERARAEAVAARKQAQAAARQKKSNKPRKLGAA
ncbi:MAG: hypothetical protein V4795_26055 [Pseudomonadota bacterium]